MLKTGTGHLNPVPAFISEENFYMSIWKIKRTKVDTAKMAKALNVREPVACVLANRKIGTLSGAKRFLDCDLNGLYDTKLFKDAVKGCDIIKKSVLSSKKIAVYGDYDVDGVMSTAILYKTLKYLGADVIFYLPHRQKEGYGMNCDAVRELKESGIDVILTCDNGIAAVEEIALAKDLGIATVVLDHHECQYSENESREKVIKIPPADAVIDAKQPECGYPFKFLCAAGMSYKFAKLLFEAFNKDFVFDKEFLSFAAVATVCDIVDMLDENRIIVKNGLKELTRTTNTGMRALIELTGISDREINEYHAGFVIGPCVNATGRLESATTAVRLFTENNYNKAYELAKELVDLNAERKEMTLGAVERAKELVLNSELKDDRVLVLYDESVHESIAGIVAGRIKEMFYKPVIMITKSGDIAKGSARSIEAYNIFEELLKCSDLFIKFGGHPMAAGLSLKKENVEILRKRLNENCTLTQTELTNVIRIEKELSFNEIDLTLARQLEDLAPFGKECPVPVFGTKKVFVKKVSLLGKKRDIIKFMLGNEDSRILIDGISFDGYEKFTSLIESMNYTIEEVVCSSVPICMDIVYCIRINRFNGRESVQLEIKDFRF